MGMWQLLLMAMAMGCILVLNEYVAALKAARTGLFKPVSRSAMLFRIVVASVGWMIGLPCFVSVINFTVAQTPAESPGKFPAHWSAAVMNHGQYSEWYAIADRPYFFAASCLGLVLAMAYLFCLIRLNPWK